MPVHTPKPPVNGHYGVSVSASQDPLVVGVGEGVCNMANPLHANFVFGIVSGSVVTFWIEGNHGLAQPLQFEEPRLAFCGWGLYELGVGWMGSEVLKVVVARGKVKRVRIRLDLFEIVWTQVTQQELIVELKHANLRVPIHEEGDDDL